MFVSRLLMPACVVFGSVDLLKVVHTFVGSDEFLFVGTVSHAFYDACLTRETRIGSCFTTVSRLQECCSLFVPMHSRVSRCLDVALERAVQANDQAMLTLLQTEFGETNKGPAIMIAAVESGSLEMVKQYCADGVLNPMARRFGLHDSFFYPFDLTARRLICLRWRMFVGDYLVDAAKRCGHFHILKWLHEQGIPVDPLCENHEIVGEAASHGNREMVEWMLRKGYKMSACEVPYACHTCDVRYLEWLLDLGCIVDPDSLEACENSDTAVHQWLRDRGYVF